jgi:hypothetical protein
MLLADLSRQFIPTTYCHSEGARAQHSPVSKTLGATEESTRQNVNSAASPHPDHFNCNAQTMGRTWERGTELEHGRVDSSVGAVASTVGQDPAGASFGMTVSIGVDYRPRSTIRIIRGYNITLSACADIIRRRSAAVAPAGCGAVRAGGLCALPAAISIAPDRTARRRRGPSPHRRHPVPVTRAAGPAVTRAQPMRIAAVERRPHSRRANPRATQPKSRTRGRGARSRACAAKRRAQRDGSPGLIASAMRRWARARAG